MPVLPLVGSRSSRPGFSSTSGVLPTRERRLSATTVLDTAGHGGEEDHRRTGRHRGVEAVERAHVVALDELRAQPGKAVHQVVEQLAHGVADGGNLAHAADLAAERGWNADRGHACAGLPWQNST